MQEVILFWMKEEKVIIDGSTCLQHLHFDHLKFSQCTFFYRVGLHTFRGESSQDHFLSVKLIASEKIYPDNIHIISGNISVSVSVDIPCEPTFRSLSVHPRTIQKFLRFSIRYLDCRQFLSRIDLHILLIDLFHFPRKAENLCSYKHVIKAGFLPVFAVSGQTRDSHDREITAFRNIEAQRQFCFIEIDVQ